MLRYSWFTILYEFQVCNILIHNFKRLYSIMVIVKYWLYSLFYTIDPCNLFISYIVVWTSELPTSILPLLHSFSALVTTSLFSISVSLFLSFFFLISFFKKSWLHSIFVAEWGLLLLRCLGLGCPMACVIRVPWPRDQIHVPCIGRQILNHWISKKSPYFCCCCYTHKFIFYIPHISDIIL